MADRAAAAVASFDNVTITYKTATGGKTYDCATVKDDLLSSGDMLEIELVAVVKPLFLPFAT